MSETERRSRGRNRPEAMFPAPAGKEEMPSDYGVMLDALKERIGSERLRVAMTANSALVLLYWDIGQMILERQRRQGWGAKVIDGFLTT